MIAKSVKSAGSFEISRLGTLVLAGGGNRCWWQAGALAHLLSRGWRLPPQLVGTSAGAGVAAACLTTGPRTAMEACLRLYAGNERIFDWRGLMRFKLRFAHQHIYPAWIECFLNAAGFDAVRSSSSQLRIAFTHPARILGLTGSVAAGTAAYLVDKYLWHSIHPRLPRLLGLRQGFFNLHECRTLADARALLNATAAAPPFMEARHINGAFAFDGGYIDNAPIPPQPAAERAKTLVLLTRHYPKLAPLFRWRERMYWQPSEPVPVSTWDCTSRTTVREAFSLGERDAMLALENGWLLQA